MSMPHTGPTPLRAKWRSFWLRAMLLGLVSLVCVLAPAGATLAQESTATVSAGEEATSTASDGSATDTPAGPQTGLAAGPTEFRTLNPGISVDEVVVTILPEYDTTSTEVLVFVDLTLPDSVPLPATVKFVVPGNARVTGFAQVDPQGQYDYNRPNPQFEAQGEYVVVTVTVPTYRSMHLEYYYSPGAGMPAQGAKSYQVTYTVPVDAQSLFVYTQEPKRAEGFAVEPGASLGETSSDGYRYAQNIFSGVKAGDQATVSVSYTKNDAETSEAPAGQPTEEQQAGASWLLWILVAVVVGILGFVAYRLFATRRPAGGTRGGGRRSAGQSAGRPGGAKTGAQQGQASGKRAAGKPAPSKQAGGGGAAANRFCTQCGARLTKRDRFCPECGQERGS